MTTKRKYFGLILGSLYFIMVLRGISYGKVVRVPLEFDTIQAGINAAESGDVVKVDAGVYIERIAIKEGIKLIGSGGEYTSIYNFDSGCTSIINMDSNCVLRGFTISSNYKVPGIKINKDSKNVEISNNKIVDCSNYGIFDDGVSSGLSSNVIIKNNSISGLSGFGRGITLSSYNLTIKNNIIFAIPHSFHTSTGLTISGYYGPIIVSNNLIYNHDRGMSCSYNRDIVPQVINNTIVNCNEGISINNSKPLIMNNIISKCKEAFDYTSYGHISFLYNYIYGVDPNSPQHSDQGTLWNVSSSPPLFIDPNNGDFHLQANSPCSDAGAPEISFNDPDGTRNDMGAYGGPGAVDWEPFTSGMPVVTKIVVSPNPVAKDGTITIKATGEIQP